MRRIISVLILVFTLMLRGENVLAEDICQPLDQQSYEASMKRISTMLIDSFDRFGPLMENPQPDQLAWKTDVATELATWRLAAREAHLITPPANLAPGHAAWLEGLDLYAEAADAYAAGLDPFDVLKITDAGRSLAMANVKLEEATALRQKASP
jgi:hypothetical protein